MKSTAVQCFIACKRGPVGAARRVGQNASAPPLPGGVAHVVSELASAVDAHWVASAENQIERDALARWPKGVEVDPDGLPPFRLSLVDHQSDVIRAAQDRLFSNILWRALHAVWDDIEEPAFGPEDARSWVAFRQFTRDVVDRLSSASFSALNPVYLLQDFQMACVPPLLRKTRPDARQALLLHCAWPSLTDWSKLPRTWRRDLAESMLHSDVVAFLAERWRRGFLEAVEADVPETNLRSGEIVEYRGRQVQVMTMPLGYSQRAIARPAAELAPEIARWAENHPLIVTYGRSDPIKGAQRAVCAFSLARTSGSGAELSRLLVRVSPNHLNVSANARYMESLQREIARTNEAAREEVVRLVVESSSTATLAAYRRADVLLVPSAVDGQNLAAFEGVMVNRRHAPLILSDHCGASELLAQGAITINPFDIVEIAGAIVRALTEERGHREVRAAQCRQLAAPYTVERWIDAQLVALGLERHTDRLVHSMDASKPKSYSQ